MKKGRKPFKEKPKGGLKGRERKSKDEKDSSIKGNPDLHHQKGGKIHPDFSLIEDESKKNQEE